MSTLNDVLTDWEVDFYWRHDVDQWEAGQGADDEAQKLRAETMRMPVPADVRQRAEARYIAEKYHLGHYAPDLYDYEREDDDNPFNFFNF